MARKPNKNIEHVHQWDQMGLSGLSQPVRQTFGTKYGLFGIGSDSRGIILLYQENIK